MGMIHNCIRQVQDVAKERFRKSGGIRLAESFLKCNNVGLKTVASFVIALSVEESEIKLLLTMQPIFAHLVEMLATALNDESHRFRTEENDFFQ